MPIVAIMTVPGMTEDQYRTVRDVLGEALQPGNLVHVAGPTEGGWQVVEVWESPDAMGAFFQSPAAGQAFQAAGVPPVRPVVTVVDTLVASAHPPA
jgi:quinol monooxygenase YgiN